MTPMNTTRVSRNALAVALAVAIAAFVVPPLAGQSQEPVDLQAIYKIKEEGLQRSKVMEITSYLTDVYGPRLTGSPNIRTAGEWAVKEMQSWGLANAKLEPGFKSTARSEPPEGRQVGCAYLQALCEGRICPSRAASCYEGIAAT